MIQGPARLPYYYTIMSQTKCLLIPQLLQWSFGSGSHFRGEGIHAQGQ